MRDVALGLSVAGVISAVIGVVAVVRIVGVRVGPVRWRALLGYGVPLAVTGLVGMLGYQLDRVIVASAFTPEEFAIYALGAVQVPVALLVRQAVNSVLVPVLSERWVAGDPVGLAGLWRDAMRKTSLVILPMFVFLMITADALVVTLFGNAYAESAGIFRVYLALLPLNVATWGLIPMAVGRTGLNVYGSIVLLVVNAAVALALIGPLGLYGAAAATPVAGLVVAVYFLARSSRLLDVPVSSAAHRSRIAARQPRGLRRRRACRRSRSSRSTWPPLPELLLAGAVFVLLCFALLRLTGRVTDEDWSPPARHGPPPPRAAHPGRRRAAVRSPPVMRRVPKPLAAVVLVALVQSVAWAPRCCRPSRDRTRSRTSPTRSASSRPASRPGPAAPGRSPSAAPVLARGGAGRTSGRAPRRSR